MPRRKPGTLVPLEIEILQIALADLQAGGSTFHGFGLAHKMQTERAGALIGHGTLYKALGRLEEMGMLASRWEDSPPPGRPRRRLYELTAAGVHAARAPRRAASQPVSPRRLAPGTP